MLYLWNAFGGGVPLKPKGYRITVAVPEADLLAEQADVRISGVHVGRVVRTEPSSAATGGDPNRKDAILEIQARYAPLRTDVRATIRRKSLAGEEYLELTPGGVDSPSVPDGGRGAGARLGPPTAAGWPAPTSRPAWRSTRCCARSTRRRASASARGSSPRPR